jgi:CheY-like chemotaxis protein
MRVLVCDDNRDAADTLEALLRAEGYETRVSNDGSVCLQTVRRWRPQVALLDIGMPGMNGYELARAIRALDFGRRIFLIAITGYGQYADVSLAKDAGFDLHMTKPASPDRVLQALAQADRRA